MKLAIAIATMTIFAMHARSAEAAIGCPVPKPGDVSCQSDAQSWPRRLPWREYAAYINLSR